ncbi:uncharacterized protein LOC134182615 isoform X2 [Corticium candelabrum]|uniref:uncharacterized protein LOC134182615 isoform X2 n=1 Tax=Corticium candelabrum TaxID=121492 RepID=UPI002E26FB13|nr:uncharacterized protein LOC134182615 isoform X2 [Corticium candelabrum]
MGELMGLSMVFLQFYGANKLTRGEYAWYRFYDDYSYDSYGESMAAYGYCLPLTTGLLLMFNSSLAILVQWTDNRETSFRSMVGPWWILTATVATVTFVMTTIDSVNYMTEGKAASGEMVATACLVFFSAVISYVLSCAAFFAGHACCYCVRNNNFRDNYMQMQTL